MKNILIKLASILTVTCFAGIPAAHAAQVVFLDFDSGTDGAIVYSGAMRNSIEALMEGHYADFDVSMTQVLPGGSFSTITFNSGGAGGLAEQIDFRNVDANDTAVVNIDGLGLVAEADIVSASAIIGSHELGHLLGLRHGDSFGPIGLGRSSTGTPAAAWYDPAYPGPATADETTDHIMASPASVGSSVGDATTPSWFSERSAIKLSNNEQGTLQNHSAPATFLFPDELVVPNTIVSGDNAGELFAVKSFTATGTISAGNESDLFVFDGVAGERYSIEVISNAIDQRVTEFDTLLIALDANPPNDPLNYYGVDSFNDDEFETADSIIIDLVIPADGSYALLVRETFAVAEPSTGGYELFGYTLRLNAAPVAVDDMYATLEDTIRVVGKVGGVLANDTDADGDPLTAVLDSDVSNGTLVFNDDGSFSYDPDPNYCGADNFTYHANDKFADSNIATVMITVFCVNDAPVAVDNNYTENEDTLLSGNVIIDNTGEGVDFDVDGDVLSIESNTDVSHGTLVLNSDGSFTYDPNLNYCGPDSFDYVITDFVPITGPPLTSNTATVSITVTCVNDPPEVTSVVELAQTSDYSDFIGTVVITVEDVDDTSTTLAESNEPPLSAAGLSLTSTGCTVVVTESPDEDGSVCTWDYDGQVLDPGFDPVDPGDNVNAILFTPSDADGAGTVTGTHTLTIQAEDAIADLDEDNPVAVQVEEEGGDSGVFSLFFSAWEKSDPDYPHDGTAEFGDLNNAQGFITLNPVGPGGPITVMCIKLDPLPVYPGEGYGQVILFECIFDEVPVNTYEVLAEVDGLTDTTIYYAGFDEGVLVIYDPSLGFVTGGGWLYWPGTCDEIEEGVCDENGYPGDKTNFGFNMKYNKGKKKNPKGSLLLMRHTETDENYKVKSNALNGLAIGDGEDGAGEYGWSAFSGKSTFRSPGAENEGNHPFLVYIEDHNDQGCNQDPNDEFWIEVKDKDGMVVLEINGPESDPAGEDTATDGDDEPIECGNIYVPHQNNGNGKP
jgi:hypothetical protein